MDKSAFDAFRGAPFNLDDDSLRWVFESLDSLSLSERVSQLLVLDELARSGIGGVFVRCGDVPEALRARVEQVRSLGGIPPLVAADLEFTAQGRLADGTDHPCQMAVGAAGETQAARRMGLIAGREAGDRGIDWIFAPVADLALDHRSPSVNIRAFGGDPDTAAALTAAYVDGAQEAGVAATLKHWPGDGRDERDQHFTTSRNAFTMDQWRRTSARTFAAGIAAGAKTVMSGHISLPAYSGSTLPATLAKELNIDLLRGELGFRGLIVSDAMVMGGATSRRPWSELAPAMVAAGCDMVLFPGDLDETSAYFERAIETGALTEERLGEASAAVLALKASLGLHRLRPRPGSLAVASTTEHAAWARDCAENSITLVKDASGTLPLNPAKTARVLLFSSLSKAFRAPESKLLLGELLEERGFEVTLHRPGALIDRDLFDLLLYVVEELPVFSNESLKIDWMSFDPRPQAAMRRYWKDMPTVFVSLGNPFHSMELPSCSTIVNAYSASEPSQAALAAALVGGIPFRGNSPVDPFCGVADESE